jgi:hypothetical protein
MTKLPQFKKPTRGGFRAFSKEVEMETWKAKADKNSLARKNWLISAIEANTRGLNNPQLCRLHSNLARERDAYEGELVILRKRFPDNE